MIQFYQHYIYKIKLSKKQKPHDDSTKKLDNIKTTNSTLKRLT